MLISTCCSSTRDTGRRGSILVFAAVTFLLVLGFAGLALDTAFVRHTGEELQAAADAAALAATEQLDFGDAGNEFEPVRVAAVSAAAANEADGAPVQIEYNYPNGSEGDVVVGTWDPISRSFSPDVSSPNAVQVRTRRTDDSPGGAVDLFFGAAFGADQSQISRSAIATLDSLVGPRVILVLEDKAKKAFDLRGSPVIHATSGSIQINSSHSSQAFYINGSADDARVYAKTIRVVGGASYPPGVAVPDPEEGADAYEDPFEDVPEPDPSAMDEYDDIDSSGTYDPGYYPDGVSLKGSKVATLNPGIYYIEDEFEIKGNAQLIATGGVMLFIDEDCEFEFKGNGSNMEITAPDSGDYQGIAIFADRSSDEDLSFGSDGTLILNGAIYAPDSRVELDGAGTSEIGRIISDKLNVRGSGLFTITGAGPEVEIPLYSVLVK